MPVQAPLQPANVAPVPAAGVNVTAVPLLKFAEHVEGQLIPAGELLTALVPASVPVRASCAAVWLNVAVTARAWLIVTEQLPVP
ncbi:MAG: hypothetical protein M3R43_03685, partial [Acidobacteriota bacterium]|nr:hypothetical protein [Acidobacteriota bacterium]